MTRWLLVRKWKKTVLSLLATDFGKMYIYFPVTGQICKIRIFNETFHFDKTYSICFLLPGHDLPPELEELGYPPPIPLLLVTKEVWVAEALLNFLQHFFGGGNSKVNMTKNTLLISASILSFAER